MADQDIEFVTDFPGILESDTAPRVLECTFKHHCSRLQDLRVRMEIDDHERRVDVVVDELDSSLISCAVFRLADEESAPVVAFSDDSAAGRRATHSVQLVLAGVCHRAEVVRLLSGEGVLRMWPAGTPGPTGPEAAGERLRPTPQEQVAQLRLRDQEQQQKTKGQRPGHRD